MLEKVVYFSISCFFCLEITQASKYVIEDLQILAKQKEYSELFSHAKDITPSKRQKEWKELVTKSARQWLEQLRIKKDFTPNKQKKILEISKWHTLKKDEFFRLKFDQYLAELIQYCYENTDEPCSQKAKDLWQNSFKSLDLSAAIVEHSLTQKQQVPSHEIYQYLLKNDRQAIFCEKKIISDFFAKNIKKIINLKAPKKSINSNISKKCWTHLKKVLQAKLKHERYLDKDLFNFLMSLNLISSHQKDQWLVVYFLKNTADKNLINLAWPVLDDLRKDYKKRKSVLKFLSQFDHLPGEIFEIENQDKRLAMTRHLATNFPEYLNLYVDQCLNYYQGTKDFPKGNPTKECHQLKKIIKDKAWIAESKKLELEKI